MKLTGAIVGAALACLASGAANAATVTYEFKGVTTDANLGGTPFDGAFDIVATGSTGGVYTAPSPPFSPDTLVAPVTIKITLDGVGEVTVTDPAYFFNNRTFKALGFGGLPMGDFLDFGSGGSPALAVYNLVSSIGPISVTGGGGQYVDTTGGLLILGFPDPGAFTAQLSVPEPATWAMMLLGFGGLGAVLRSRRRRQACAVSTA